MTAVSLQTVTPELAIQQSIAESFASLSKELRFEDLLQYVEARKPGPGCVESYRPGFAKLPFVHFVVQAPFQKQRLNYFGVQIDCLEMALAHCLAAHGREAPSVAPLLHSAQLYCVRFEDSRLDEIDTITRMRQARARGGAQTQAKRDPCRQRVVTLLQQLQPQEGWASIDDAVKVITPILREEILLNGWTILPYETLPKTVKKWLTKHPQIRRALRFRLRA